jgi:hypothetical protein
MRAGSMGDFGLGDLVDVDDNVQDDNRKFVPIRKLPRFAVHVDGRFRMTCGDEIILSKDDMFNPSSKKENEPDFDWDKWATDEIDGWDIRGNNRYDEICNNYFSNELFDFIVQKVTVSRWGDLKIEFENGFALETFVDVSLDDECWRFFVTNTSDSHIVITGQGLSADDDVAE